MWGTQGTTFGYSPYPSAGRSGKGNKRPSNKRLSDEQLRELGEQLRDVLANFSGGLRMSQLPALLLARTGVELRKIKEQGGFNNQKGVLEAVAQLDDSFFEIRPDPAQPSDIMLYPADGAARDREPEMPPFQELPGEDPLLRAARLAEHRQAHQERLRRLRQQAQPSAAAQGRSARGTRAGTGHLQPRELRRVAENIKDCLESDPRHAEGVRMAQVPLLLQARHGVVLKEVKERGGFLSQRALIMAMPSGFFEVRPDPLSSTGDIILFPLGAPNSAKATAAASPTKRAPAPEEQAVELVQPAVVCCPYCDAKLQVEAEPGVQYKCPTCSGMFAVQ
eukprot:TRINITY_DN51530_c0_g1_i1.p1 TRINITY_DN51530_c0_g1~~TRINITY_DN51530_c0_g1_i1.p1  ORF type:complete len:335 (+),score=63.95 TRINITY_DN51530_c0_g1_i1:71-1075(+)